MNLLCLDFETYYDKDYSLTKMTTEEYIRSPLFEIIGVAVSVNGAEPEWFSGSMDATALWLRKFDWENSMVLAHNAMFDMSILNWQCGGIRPKRIADTLSMARALHGTEVRGSLAYLAEHYAVGVKGEEVVKAIGKRRQDFSETELTAYAAYCRNDVSLTVDIFKIMADGFVASEMGLIDLTIRMFSEPKLTINSIDLLEHLGNIKADKEKLLDRVGITRKELMSNNKFAEVLRKVGVVPPTKISKTTGKRTHAFAKNDENFKALLSHHNPDVQALVAARLGVKSTLEETRTQRFIGIAGRGLMPVPLRYYAAHTGRWGGDDKLNLQNLPRTSPLKKSILAPEGHVIIDADSSQIEARTLAWLAGEQDLVDAFAYGKDVYRLMAAKIYNTSPAAVSKEQRFVGKVTVLGCLAAGSMILCGRGWVPIEQVSAADKVWDGEEWVCHQGLVPSGLKETVNLCGLWLTPDHRVWSGTQWLEAQSVVADGNILSQVLDVGAANLPSQGISQVQEGASKRLLSNVSATAGNIPLTGTTSKTLKAQGAIFALKNQLQKLVSCIGGTPTYYQTMNIGNGYLTGCLPLSVGATPPLANTTNTMEVVGYPYTNNGGKIGHPFSATYKRLKAGIFPSLKWIELKLTGTMNPTTSGLYPEATTSKTNVESKHLKKLLPTYDLAFAGPRNRYTVLTEQGPVIVHNCGYGMGADKFQAMLLSYGVGISLAEAEAVISIYRSANPKIKAIWEDAQVAVRAMAEGKTCSLGKEGVLEVHGLKGIKLPNGLFLKYPNLRKMVNKEKNQYEYVYDNKRGRAVVLTKLYGGKLVENICQALARIAIGEQMLNVATKIPVVLTVHDAVAGLMPEDKWAEGMVFISDCMRTAPAWAEGLPFNCEVGYGKTYSDSGNKQTIESWGL